MTINGLCGIPDSIQDYVRSAVKTSGTGYMTINREVGGFRWQADQTGGVGSNIWTVRLVGVQ